MDLLRMAYIMAMAIIQSEIYNKADDELRESVDESIRSYNERHPLAAARPVEDKNAV